jgi:hypothetical protein
MTNTRKYIRVTPFLLRNSYLAMAKLIVSSQGLQILYKAGATKKLKKILLRKSNEIVALSNTVKGIIHRKRVLNLLIFLSHI